MDSGHNVIVSFNHRMAGAPQLQICDAITYQIWDFDSKDRVALMIVALMIELLSKMRPMCSCVCVGGSEFVSIECMYVCVRICICVCVCECVCVCVCVCECV